jgi:hypothetical protein
MQVLEYSGQSERRIGRSAVLLTLHPLPAAGGQAREGRPPRCISGQAAAARRVVVVDTPHWGAAAASPARATASDSCSTQQEHAPVRKTCCWGSTKAIHNAKTVYFFPNINRVRYSCSDISFGGRSDRRVVRGFWQAYSCTTATQ